SASPARSQPRCPPGHQRRTGSGGSRRGWTTWSSWAVTGSRWARSSPANPTATTPWITSASTRASAPRPTSTTWCGPAGSAGSGCCSTGCSITWAGASLRSRMCSPAAPRPATRPGSGWTSRPAAPTGSGTRTSRDTAAWWRSTTASPRCRTMSRACWRTVTGRVRRDHPRAWIAGELIHGDFVAAIREGGLDSVTQYELWKAIWSSLNDGNFFELAWALDRHDSFAAAFRPLTFVGNHDVTRLASKLADPRHFAHALVILLTVAGTPSIYAGDEQAFRGVKHERADGDAEIRPAFPDSPGDLAPDGWPVPGT